MKTIDENRLESDLEYRVQYLAEFMGFGDADIAIIHGAAPLLGPLVPGLVDAVYEKLFTYNATKRHFVPKQSGYEGAVPTDLASLTVDHEMVKFRKQHLSKYLEALVTRPYDAKMFLYLDKVGQIHTPQAGNPEINVPLVQMNALMGFVADAVTNTIFNLKLDRDAEISAIRAFQKLLWVQNDLIVRHYAK
ncbi:MAG: protoglobin family protein [Zavarzinella sp.]